MLLLNGQIPQIPRVSGEPKTKLSHKIKEEAV